MTDDDPLRAADDGALRAAEVRSAPRPLRAPSGRYSGIEQSESSLRDLRRPRVELESSLRGRRRPRVELVSIDGNATDEERRTIEESLVQMVEAERAATTSSVWLRAARSQGRRLGMLDYRDRFSRDDAWRLSTRFPFGGREYPGRVGRGDTR